MELPSPLMLRVGNTFLPQNIFLKTLQRLKLFKFFNKKWIKVNVLSIGVSVGEVDLVVLSPSIRLSLDMPFEPSHKGLVIGQDVYFVGFPLKMWTDAGEALAGRPCPFIKKGTLSSAFEEGDGISRLYIDALNN